MFPSVLSAQTHSGEGRRGGRVDIQDSEHGRIMGQGSEYLNLRSGRGRGISLSTDDGTGNTTHRLRK